MFDNRSYSTQRPVITDSKKTIAEKKALLGCLFLPLIIFGVLFLVLIGGCVVAYMDGAFDKKPLSVQEKRDQAESKARYSAEAVLKENLRDPSSLEIININSVPQNLPGKNGFVVYIKYRAKNGFGGYTIEEKYFTADSEGNLTNILRSPEQ